MATLEHRPGRGPGPSEWILFGAVVMFVVGGMNAVLGLVALLKDEVFMVTTSRLVLEADWSVWGGTLLVWGGLLVVVALGLVRAAGWARWTAIVLVVLNLIAQIVLFPAHPLWCTVVIALDTLVLFSLTAAWPDARAGLRARR